MTRRWPVGVAALAAAWAAPAAAPVVPPLARPFGITLRLLPPTGIALTFDDGPHPRGTPAVLDVLARAGARATFFLVGEQVERGPALAAEIAAAGHELAVHGYRHALQLRRTPWDLEEDLARAGDLVAVAAGVAPTLYRPPYGVFSLAGLALTRRHGWRATLWSRWGRDWEKRAGPVDIARRATRNLSAGDVVLLHDSDSYSASGSWSRTAAALPAILEAARATGEQLVPVGEVLGTVGSLRYDR
jgi:peptidoglycan-N-acetylglucosamine deacetylase